MPTNRSKPSSNRFSFTSTTSTSSTPSNPPISRTSTSNSNGNPFSPSSPSTQTKTTAAHPHYCPAAYHATPRVPPAETIELDTFDTDEHYWDNVRLNSHLSIDAWKTQSKVAQKAAAAASQSRKSEDDSDEGVSDASSGVRGRTQWRRGGRGSSSVDKEAGVGDVREQHRCIGPEGWKVCGLRWTVGLSGV